MYIVVEPRDNKSGCFLWSCRKSRRNASGIQCTPVLPSISKDRASVYGSQVGRRFKGFLDP